MRDSVVLMKCKEGAMQATIEQIQQAVANWSIEVTPVGASKIDSFADC